MLFMDRNGSQYANLRTRATETLRCKTWQRPEEMDKTSANTATEELKEDDAGACGTQKKAETWSCETRY